MEIPWAEPSPRFTTVSRASESLLRLMLCVDMFRTIATFSVYGYPLVPCAITDAAGNVSVALVSSPPSKRSQGATC